MADIKANISAMVKELREGEAVSRSKRFTLEDLEPAKLKKAISSMRNSMNQIASRAREETERDYRVETGQFVTHDGSAVIATCVITCMNDEGDDDI